MNPRTPKPDAHRKFAARALEIRNEWSPTQKANRKQIDPVETLGGGMLVRVQRDFARLPKVCEALTELAEACCVSVAWLQSRHNQSAVPFTEVCKACGLDADEVRAQLLGTLGASDWAVLRAWDEILGGERKLLEYGGGK